MTNISAHCYYYIIPTVTFLFIKSLSKFDVSMCIQENTTHSITDHDNEAERWL